MSTSRPHGSWVRNTHSSGNREDKVRYKDPQLTVGDVCNVVLTNTRQPVMQAGHCHKCEGKYIAHDIHKQQRNGIAIDDENDFW